MIGGTDSMGNSSLSKIKILYLYDYFLHEMDPADEGGVLLSDLIDMLEAKTGEVFERKSIYSDISRINEYVTGSRGYEGSEFIYREGNRYRRDELKDEILITEARLISDSLRTTEFVPEQIYDKFEAMFPAFFNGDRQDSARLYSRSRQTKKSEEYQTKYLLPFLCDSINDKTAIKITYGYKITNSIVGSSFVVSPLYLDWTNSHYYLIAIDNMSLFKRTGFEKKATDADLKGSIKRFRLDRIDKKTEGLGKVKDASKLIKDRMPEIYSALFETGEKITAQKRHAIAEEFLRFHGFNSDEDKRKYVTEYLSSSFEGFGSSNNVKTIRMTLESTDKDAPGAWKNVLQAFSVFKDEFKITSGSIGELESEKKLTFAIEAPDVPPLYKFLFSIYTFDTVDLTIENSEIRERFKNYLTKALEALH